MENNKRFRNVLEITGISNSILIFGMFMAHLLNSFQSGRLDTFDKVLEKNDGGGNEYITEPFNADGSLSHSFPELDEKVLNVVKSILENKSIDPKKVKLVKYLKNQDRTFGVAIFYIDDKGNVSVMHRNIPDDLIDPVDQNNERTSGEKK